MNSCAQFDAMGVGDKQPGSKGHSWGVRRAIGPERT